MVEYVHSIELEHVDYSTGLTRYYHIFRVDDQLIAGGISHDEAVDSISYDYFYWAINNRDYYMSDIVKILTHLNGLTVTELLSKRVELTKDEITLVEMFFLE